METAFKTHIETRFSFLKNAKLLIACSGGLDSVVLTYLLKRLKYNIVLAHCNFSLRGKESDEDSLFVEKLAEKIGAPIHIEKFNTQQFAEEHSISTQMAARELRYAWFDELRNGHGYDFVLTAHHADDAMETFFINLSRGTGLRGLTGIPEQNDAVVRPMLPFSREQIERFAKKHAIYWREDSSNTKTVYLRNKLRLEVLPSFKEISDQTLQNFQKTQQYLRNSEALIEDYMALVYNLVVTEVLEGYRIDVAKISELPNTETLLYELLHPFGFTAWGDIYNLLNAQTGKEVLSSTHRLLRNRNELLLSEISENEAQEEFFIKKKVKEINTPIHLCFIPTKKIGNIENTTIYVDADLLEYPLTIRKWQKGDVFQPFGMKGKKKVSKFFKDEKLSLVAKQKVWLLCSNDKIVWVIGHRADARFRITESTQQLLKITTAE